MSPPPAKLNDVGAGGAGGTSAGALATRFKPMVATTRAAVSVTPRIRLKSVNMAHLHHSAQSVARGPEPLTGIDSPQKHRHLPNRAKNHPAFACRAGCGQLREEFRPSGDERRAGGRAFRTCSWSVPHPWLTPVRLPHPEVLSAVARGRRRAEDVPAAPSGATARRPRRRRR